MEHTEYIPGKCNIGADEVRRRTIIGYAGLITTILMTGVLAAISGPPLTGILIVFVSATMSSYGFLQAHAKFCVVYGFVGIFNFGLVGEKSRVTEQNARRADLKRAFQINALAIGIGIIYGGILYYLLR